MKKQFIAAAVATALAAPAMAQNVSITGLIDMAYDFSGRNTTNALQASNVSTSNIVLSGSEDLGGGLKASFDIASDITGVLNQGDRGSAASSSQLGSAAPAAGGATAASNSTGSVINFGDRGARIGLSGSFGAFYVGKTTGTAINGLRGGAVGNFSLLHAGGFVGDTDRPAETIDYVSPTINGLNARVLYQTTTKSSELSANYAVGNLKVGVAYADVKGATNNGKDLGAQVQYKLSGVTLIYGYQNVETAAAASDGTYQTLSASIPLTSTTTLGVDFQDKAGNADKVNAGVFHNLSKRTNVYAVYSKANGDSEAQMLAGVRHSF